MVFIKYFSNNLLTLFFKKKKNHNYISLPIVFLLIDGLVTFLSFDGHMIRYEYDLCTSCFFRSYFIFTFTFFPLFLSNIILSIIDYRSNYFIDCRGIAIWELISNNTKRIGEEDQVPFFFFFFNFPRGGGPDALFGPGSAQILSV